MHWTEMVRYEYVPNMYRATPLNDIWFFKDDFYVMKVKSKSTSRWRPQAVFSSL